MRRLLAAAALTLAFAYPASAADTVRLGKVQPSAWTFLAADLGIERGLFAKYGVEVQIVESAGDAKLQQALASDSIDLGLGSGPGMAFAAKGSPVVAVAAFAGEPRNLSAIVPADSPVETVAGLKGKLLAVSTVGSLSEWLAKQMAIQEGWGEDGIRTVAVGAVASGVMALRAHQVDGIVMGTEAGFILEEQKAGRIVTGMERYAPHFITHVVFARKDLVARNPDLVARFLKGFMAAVAIVKKDKAGDRALAERVLHMSPAVADRCFDAEAGMLETSGTFDPAAVAALKKSYVEMGTLDREPPDGTLFTTRFVPVKP
jgi:ABC-type nitrate/sulfonate/bicarbonate transport system substrate-binding protein